MRNLRVYFFLALLAYVFPVSGQEGTPIIFLPPPMEGGGTISIGIFNAAGKLVRVLHRHASVDDFKQGENGLITRWDGKDDAGQNLPAGKFSVRGLMAGDLGVEGVAFHGNDWFKEDAPRYSRVVALKGVGRDEVQVTLRTLDGKDETLGWKLAREGAEPPVNEVSASIEQEKLIIKNRGTSVPVLLGEGEKPVACVSGHRGRVWAIIENSGEREVRSYSPEGEFLRRLPYEKNDPQPVQIAASQWSEMIFLLEENGSEQRLRSLALDVPAKGDSAKSEEAAKSSWRTTLQKRIYKSDTFETIAPHLGREKPPKAEVVIVVALRANPLLGDAKAEASLKIINDLDGAVLTTVDGLPVSRLTASRNLKWAVLVREGKSPVFFQGDGCVVEEFKITHPENIMTFDAGEIELRPEGNKSGATGSNKRAKPKRPGDDL